MVENRNCTLKLFGRVSLQRLVTVKLVKDYTEKESKQRAKKCKLSKNIS